MSMKALFVALPIALGLLLAELPGARAQQAPGGSEDEPSLVAKGAQLYSHNCGRCHNMRPSSERGDGEWSVIVAHMRARANLTRGEAEALLAFLQATNVDTHSLVEAPAPPSAESVATPAPPRVPSEEIVTMLEGIRAGDDH